MPDILIQDHKHLTGEISKNYESLSKRLRDVAEFALDNPTTMALETVANISKSVNVPPSTLVRFSKAFGFSGFSEMQRVFQSHVTDQSASYKERIRTDMSKGDQENPDSPYALLKQYCENSIVSLNNLQSGVCPDDLCKAVELIKSANHIYIMAQRRSLAVANYLLYMFSHFDCRVHLLDGNGGMIKEQAQGMQKQDLLIAVTFHPYSAETLEIITRAAESEIPYIAITDSSVSPIASNATVNFNIHDAKVHQFRSLSASMLLAQVLATSLTIED
jgi:DNA-binding MurR/RpiR family transcriptional regulator